MDMGVPQLELPYHVSGICGQDAQSCYQDYRSERMLVSQTQDLYRPRRGQTYGTSPRVAAADGSDRMPKETVSAIMTSVQIRVISSEI